MDTFKQCPAQRAHETRFAIRLDKNNRSCSQLEPNLPSTSMRPMQTNHHEGMHLIPSSQRQFHIIVLRMTQASQAARFRAHWTALSKLRSARQ